MSKTKIANISFCILVSGNEWVKQETGHRSYCAVKSKEHRDILSEMPRTSLPCDNCGELLRIWPSNMGPPYFRCKESSCWSKAALIQNNGTNRFNCFTCDLDTCRECGNAEMADSKDLKDDPLVMAASVFKHRGSRSSVKVIHLTTTAVFYWKYSLKKKIEFANLKLLALRHLCIFFLLHVLLVSQFVKNFKILRLAKFARVSRSLVSKLMILSSCILQF